MNKLWITRYPWLKKIFAAKNPWRVHLFCLPLFIFWGDLALFYKSYLSVGVALASACFGYFYWTFVEYLIHRFYFHWQPQKPWLQNMINSFHIYHHQVPTDLTVINSGWLTALMGTFLHFSILWVITAGSTAWSLFILLATLLTYNYYEWIHYLVHQRKFQSGFLSRLQAFHLTHHILAHQNFGQISFFWDHVFGTFTPPLNDLNSPQMNQFIKSERVLKRALK